jgi:TonB-linked SusC/RagA family outer membrane protein
MTRLLRTSALLVALILIGVPTALAQVTVSGTVTDDAGNPMPGVNVSVAGTTQGTVTDFDGEYELAVITQDAFTLVYRFIGFRTEERLITVTVGSTQQDVQMRPDILGLDEIVVTGASGETERRQLGNAVATVGGDELSNGGATDLTAALSGKVPGALIQQTSGSPAGGISVKLRGTSTINSGAEPLYIIDGVIVDNSSNELVEVGNGGVQNRLVDINPNDIERIEIIKGAAAAAIYGSRASNGVVQIFTKRGQSGAPQITFTTSVQHNSLREKIRTNEAPFDWANPTDNSDLTKVPVERFGDEYQDYIFPGGMGTEQYLSVSGGQGNTNYFVSGSYFFNEGIIRNSDFERATLRMRLGQQLADWARVDVGAGFTRSASNDVPTGGGNFFDGAITTLQFIPGTVDASPNANGEYPAPGNAFFGNPYEVVDRYQFSQDVSRTNASVNVTLTPLDGFTATLIGGYDGYSQAARGFKPVGTVAQANGFASRGDLNRSLYNTDLTLTYVTDLGEVIRSTSTAGGTYQYDRVERITASANNLGPIVQTVDGGTITSSSDIIAETSLFGAFGQQTLGFDERLFLTVAGRVDGASVFGEDAGLQFYPKVSGSYVLSEEGFWQNSLGGTVDFFKLRASYGEAGNLTGIGAYERFTNYNPVPFNGQTGLIPSTALGNEDLRPERQREFEVGFDAAFFDSRLGTEFTYYDQTIDDLLLRRVLAPSTGATTRIENAGQLTNKGIELLVRGSVIRQSDLNLDVTAIYSRNRNEVTQLNGPAFAIGGNFGAQWAIEGQPLGVFYWRAYARDENGNLLLTPEGLPQAERGVQNDISDPDSFEAQRDANGQPTGSLLRIVVGDPEPDWTGSLITNLDYKAFSFRMQWDAVQGFDVFNWNRRNFDRHNYRGGYDYGLELEEGSTIPKGTANAAGSGLIVEEYLEDGSFIKLREVSAAYTFRPQVAGVQSLELRLTGRNLFSIDDYRGYDPEVSVQGRDTGVTGFDFGAVPIPRQVMLSASLRF